MTLPIKNLAIGGYRSFGKNIQYFENFEKVNLFIGRNNSGKSNILRFVSEIVFRDQEKKNENFDRLSYHKPDWSTIIMGHGEKAEDLKERLLSINKSENHNKLKFNNIRNIIDEILKEKTLDNNSGISWSLKSIPDNKHLDDSWWNAFINISNDKIFELWNYLTLN